MRRTIIKVAAAALMISACPQVIGAQENSTSGLPRVSPGLSRSLDRAIAFAIRLEIHANRLENRVDVCVGFGKGLVVGEKVILSELKHEKLQVHSDEWCNRGVRGLTVSLIPPIEESEPGTYELTIEVGDLRPIRERGEHFGTLVRRGKYTVKCRDGVEPELVRFQKTALPGCSPCG